MLMQILKKLKKSIRYLHSTNPQLSFTSLDTRLSGNQSASHSNTTIITLRGQLTYSRSCRNSNAIKLSSLVALAYTEMENKFVLKKTVEYQLIHMAKQRLWLNKFWKITLNRILILFQLFFVISTQLAPILLAWLEKIPKESQIIWCHSSKK